MISVLSLVMCTTQVIPLGKDFRFQYPWRELLLATFRLEHEDDYEYEFKVLSTRTSKIFARQT